MDDFFRSCVENGVNVNWKYMAELNCWELTLYKEKSRYCRRFDRKTLETYNSNLKFTTIMIDILEKFIKEAE